MNIENDDDGLTLGRPLAGFEREITPVAPRRWSTPSPPRPPRVAVEGRARIFHGFCRGVRHMSPRDASPFRDEMPLSGHQHPGPARARILSWNRTRVARGVLVVIFIITR